MMVVGTCMYKLSAHRLSLNITMDFSRYFFLYDASGNMIHRLCCPHPRPLHHRHFQKYPQSRSSHVEAATHIVYPPSLFSVRPSYSSFKYTYVTLTKLYFGMRIMGTRLFSVFGSAAKQNNFQELYSIMTFVGTSI